MELQVELEQFEGPLDLLLYLIKKNEVDIYDIPITKITEQYLEYLKFMQDKKLDIAGEFFVMAATLIRIKTLMLLPKENADEEIQHIEDPRQELIDKLLEYKKIKELSEKMFQLQEKQSKIFYRGYFSEYEYIKDDYVDLNFSKFFSIYKSSANRIIDKLKYIEVYKDATPIEEIINIILSKIEDSNHLRFFEVIDRTNLSELIVGFMAILELSKLQRIRLIQNILWGEIWLEKV